MEELLRFEVRTYDPAFHDVDIRAHGTRFTGSARVFVRTGALGEFADVLEGFPRSTPDSRYFALGAIEEDGAGGRCSLRFETTGSLGASVLIVEIADDPQKYTRASAKFTIPIEAAAVDRFVRQVRDVAASGEGIALLSSI